MGFTSLAHHTPILPVEPCRTESRGACAKEGSDPVRRTSVCTVRRAEALGPYNRVNTIGEENVRRLKLLKPGGSRASLVVRRKLVKTMNCVYVAQPLLNSEVTPTEG